MGAGLRFDGLTKADLQASVDRQELQERSHAIFNEHVAGVIGDPNSDAAAIAAAYRAAADALESTDWRGLVGKEAIVCRDAL